MLAMLMAVTADAAMMMVRNMLALLDCRIIAPTFELEATWTSPPS
jgi:hypothetical protein